MFRNGTRSRQTTGAFNQQSRFGNQQFSEFPTPRNISEKWGTPTDAGLRPDFESGLLERLYRGSFVVFYVEDGVKLGDLEQIIDLLGEIQQLQFATLILGRGESAYQFADA